MPSRWRASSCLGTQNLEKRFQNGPTKSFCSDGRGTHMRAPFAQWFRNAWQEATGRKKKGSAPGYKSLLALVAPHVRTWRQTLRPPSGCSRSEFWEARNINTGTWDYFDTPASIKG